MKRIRAGILILLFLLASTAAAAYYMAWLHAPLQKTLDAAAEAAEVGDIRAAITLAEEAFSCWQSCRQITALFADHSPMDQMDGLFAELQTYGQQQEMPHLAATCRHLAFLCRSTGENHALSWLNLM